MGEIGPAEPWAVRETALSEGDLRQAESLFALANGHIGLRGNLDEGDPVGMPGTYLNSLFEERDLTYPEAGYGFPQRTQTVVDAPDGKVIRLTVDGDPFDVRTGTVHRHERVLDLRAGTLRRDVDWTSPSGARIRLSSTRVVSFTHPAVAAIRWEVTAGEGAVTVRVESDLAANQPQPEQRDDPRASAVVESPFEALSHADDVLLHRTKRSKIEVASAVAHEVSTGRTEVRSEPDRIRTVVTAELPAGGSLRLDKIIAYAWSEPDPLPKARADRDEAVRVGFDTLCDEQRAYLDDFWAGADVELEGDPEVQQGVRFGLFHVLQAGAQAGPHPIAAKGLTGNGYDGHTLWDTETFVLPLLTYTHPACVGSALRWRHRTLGAARDRAEELRLAGATYPWRTISGPECSGYWPAGTAALHVNADIAAAVLRYVAATGDEDFLEEAGLEILAETARLWARLIHVDDHGVAHIDGVTGPDEYTALVDDNMFTNLMAQHNLLGAASYGSRMPGVADDEIARWKELAEALFLPYSATRNVHEQHSGFTRFEEWDFSADGYPLFMHYPYLDLYRRQVVKQADLVLAMMLRGDAFTAEEKLRNFVYYEARTVRDSSLSAPAQAVLAAETGHLDLAHDYLAEAALLDLRGGGESSGDGLHIAACAGAWTALVMGFGGLRDHDGRLSFAPRLPRHLPRLRFRLRWRDSRLVVTITPGKATYEVSGGELSFTHHDTPVTVAEGDPVTLPLPSEPVREAPFTPRPPSRATSPS
ncbi:glycoside hydrolase family 65 protein [Actinoplanes sp. RD1]|uniref:glycoside hydrolase family 65 protein n=1 Tax=Actinoplanes sp. RD1 TaxID=3064538 RepID=UPI0027403A56|nr:glycosyl hydrolase family 65 protein [Actinoplanes sp. RD1]